MIRYDRANRRYLEVLPYADGPVKAALAALPPTNHSCVTCGVTLVHGTDRYFQRTEPMDVTSFGDRMKRVLLALTYDPVCGKCGDQALADVMTAVARFHIHRCQTCGREVGCASATCHRLSADCDHATHAVPEEAHVYRGEFMSNVS